jgi:hypothetical protein
LCSKSWQKIQVGEVDTNRAVILLGYLRGYRYRIETKIYISSREEPFIAESFFQEEETDNFNRFLEVVNNMFNMFKSDGIEIFKFNSSEDISHFIPWVKEREKNFLFK